VDVMIEEIKEKILRLLKKEAIKGLPRRIVEQNLIPQYDPGDVKKAIFMLLDEFVIDLVVDYPTNNQELDSGHPIWFLKILRTEESRKLQELSPLKLRLLQILRETSDSHFPGEVPFSKVKTMLLVEGFDDDDIQWVIIKNKVTKLWSTIDGKQTYCFTLIPEYEKTEEHKRAREKAANYATEKELRDMEFGDL
jgi:hypothetical protein